MYAPGHLALGYFAASLTRKNNGSLQRLLIVWFFSLLPDIDLLLPFMSHRGDTHSIAAILILVAVSLIWQGFLPYAAVYANHILVDDLITRGSPLLWPIRNQYIGFRFLFQPSLFESIVEIILFTAMLLSIQLKEDWIQEENTC